MLDYFGGRMVGLTATPADLIERNTFLEFECPGGTPLRRLPVAIAKVALCHGQNTKSIQCSSKVMPEFVAYALKHDE